MGPILLFDKSFIQNLTLDESVWLDAFFFTNVCPIFYVETLADIEKKNVKGRNAIDEVRIIADKFPQMNSAPCAYHNDMIFSSLLGYDITETGQIPLSDSRTVEVNGELGVISEDSTVSAAFLRWQDYKFHEIEKEIAKAWRQAINNEEVNKNAEILNKLGVLQNELSTPQQIYDCSKRFVNSLITDDSFSYYLDLLSIPTLNRPELFTRWNNLGNPSLEQFASYAAFVCKVKVFFTLSYCKDMAYTRKPTTKIDSTYLYYLPFCMVFTSSDKFHQQNAPLFLRENQDFIWGPILKECLRWLNEYYNSLPQSEKDKGVRKLSSTLPEGTPDILIKLWDKHLPKWRELAASRKGDSKHSLDNIMDKTKRMENASTISASPESFRVSDINSVVIKRRIRKTRGSWNMF